VDFFFPPHKDLGHLHGDRGQGKADRGTGIPGPIRRGSGTADKGIGISGDFYNFDNWINFKKTLKLITEKIIKLKKGTDEITTLPNTKYSKARGIVPKCGISSSLRGFPSVDNDKARMSGPCHISDRWATWCKRRFSAPLTWDKRRSLMMHRPRNTTHLDRFIARPGRYRRTIEETASHAPG